MTWEIPGPWVIRQHTCGGRSAGVTMPGDHGSHGYCPPDARSLTALDASRGPRLATRITAGRYGHGVRAMACMELSLGFSRDPKGLPTSAFVAGLSRLHGESRSVQV